MKKSVLTVALAVAGAVSLVVPATAQVAGSTSTSSVSVVQATQVAMGWSVKKTVLGKTVYNDAGDKVGKVEDLIIAPDRNVSYVIIGAGGFIGMGRHDVAVPVSEIQNQQGRLVMAGATKALLKSMPEFKYTSDTARREQFVATAERDIGLAKGKLADLQKRASSASADAKGRMDLDISAVQLDMRSAETKLLELKGASAARWQDFEASVSAATERLRKSVEKAMG